MQQAIPLLTHTDPEQVVAWKNGKAISVRQFLADVELLVTNLPAGKYLLNLCHDRYCFSVGLAAAILSRKVTLLPPSHTPEMIRQLKLYAADVYYLSDSEQAAVELPYVNVAIESALLKDSSSIFAMPQIDSSQCMAVMFTSGSTGVPQPHEKSWGAMVHNVRAGAARLGVTGASVYTVIATVPPQHMYGLEATVLMVWQSGNALCNQQPFYPADICAVIASVPEPRFLISSPVHLRTLFDSGLQPQKLALLLSATAPLSIELAQNIEACCHAPLLEIYGSTETGMIATRQPSHDAEWHLLPHVSLIAESERMYAASKYFNQPMVMNDIIVPTTAEQFLLQGRTADLINIAGKRNSLDNLNHQLNSIDGVIDGVFFMPEEVTHDHVTRLAAFVVAPTLDASRVLTALRERVDAVFLPRPLIFLAQLPRNSTGKLPRAVLQTLLQTHVAGEAS